MSIRNKDVGSPRLGKGPNAVCRWCTATPREGQALGCAIAGIWPRIGLDCCSVDHMA